MDDTMDPVVGYLRAHRALYDMNNMGRPDFTHRSYEELILDLGQSYTRKPLPTGVDRGQMKQCYQNSTTVVFTDPDRFGYVEGYAYGGILAVQHAWVLDRTDGLIFDPTWPEDDDHTVYRGIEFPWEFVCRKMVERGVYGLLGNDWEFNCEILREGEALWTT